jgi:hypothetical protein
MIYTEIKYLNIISPRLEKFKKKGNTSWNFRCPICGDSQKNLNRARGYVYSYKNALMYKCHNCNASLTFGKLLETLDSNIHKEYLFEKFQENNTLKKVKINKKKVNKIISEKPKFTSDPFKDCQKLEDLNITHPAREYILNRKLPIEGLYYTDQFKEWSNTLVKNKFKDVSRDEGRIIIPLIDRNQQVFGYQGRSLTSDDSAKYITILLDEDHVKVFGMNTVDMSKTVYVVEGPFDSMLLENSIAMAGASISEISDLEDATVVYVFDNQPRNVAICKQVKKKIDEGHSVVIWPTIIHEKDINEMHLAGYDVNKIVSENTYNGLIAELKYTIWRK